MVKTSRDDFPIWIFLLLASYHILNQPYFCINSSTSMFCWCNFLQCATFCWLVSVNHCPQEGDGVKAIHFLVDHHVCYYFSCDLLVIHAWVFLLQRLSIPIDSNGNNACSDTYGADYKHWRSIQPNQIWFWKLWFWCFCKGNRDVKVERRIHTPINAEFKLAKHCCIYNWGQTKQSW